MHQDHGTSPAICQGALDLGFGSVMMDGSLTGYGGGLQRKAWLLQHEQRVRFGDAQPQLF